MKTPDDPNKTELIELCGQLEDQARLLRDYGTTPGNVWLARGELLRIQTLLTDIEVVIDRIAAS